METGTEWQAVELTERDEVLPEPPREPATQRGKGSRYSTLAAIVLDYLSICAGSAIAMLLHSGFGGAHVANERLKFFAFSCQYAVAFILFGRMHSLYTYKHSLLQIRDTAAILRISTFCLLLVSVESFFSKMVIPRSLLLLSCILITMFLLAEKHIFRRIFARWRAQHSRERRVIILGVGWEARRLFSFLLHSPELRMRPVGFFEEQINNDDERIVYSHGYQFKEHARVYNGQLDGGLLRSLNVSEIFIADPTLSPLRLAEIAALSAQRSIPLSFVASALQPVLGRQVNFQVLDGLFVSSFSGKAETSLGYEMSKRVLDVIVALSMLVASLPLWIIAAAWVRLSSEGPIFFRQERIGHNGTPFKMLKFRSMYVTAARYERSPEEGQDPRVTSAGQFLRKTSLDELPQLINVLLGQMSLVGPRPEMPYVVSQYNSYQRQRLNVQQGLTGMWQLSADRKHAIHKSLEYDLYYIENRGIFLDLAILLHTAAFAMKGI